MTYGHLYCTSYTRWLQSLLRRLQCLRSLLLSESPELDTSDADSELESSDSEEPELPESGSDSETAFCCCMISLVIFFRYSRRFSVSPPRPIEVEKFIENLVFLRVIRKTFIQQANAKVL
ncbi:hypothetical protein NE237_021153 [Protea cynaroides]|uniref:Uncharacterized protein n=1 Tax=Protea cynaroides TaxID=273540 RepID=A0A9Q0H800_9MAGN|nr:hypothetical protein NE237_021153 [Protea cynaroides]